MLKPWNKERDNAVVQAAFGVVFLGRPTPDEVRNLAGNLLSGEEPHERAVVAVPGDWVPLGEKNLPPLNGFWLGYQNRDDGVSAVGLGTVDVGNFTVTVHLSEYPGWETAWTEGARPIFSGLLPKVPDNLPLLRTELLFVDRFLWSGDISEFKMDSVFKSDVPRTGPLPSDSAPFWRSQCASSETAVIDQLQLSHSCATEIKIDNPQPGATVPEVWIDITVNQTMAPPSPDALRTLLKPEKLDQQMARMHDKNKDILRLLLTDETCESISLGGRR